MPTLNLRVVGMSYVLEGFDAAGLDGRVMLDALSKAFGMAVAPMSAGIPVALSVDGIILDRKAATWDAIRGWIEAWMTQQGCQYVSWAEDGRTTGSATLHFHR